MNLLSELRARLTATDAELDRLRKQPGDGQALDEAAGRLSMLRARRELIAGTLAEAEAAEQAKDSERAAKDAERERQRTEAVLRARRDALTAQWQRWGERMTVHDSEVRELWGQYHDMARAALELASDARAAGVQLLGPDTRAAVEVMQAIAAGASPLKDWHR